MTKRDIAAAIADGHAASLERLGPDAGEAIRLNAEIAGFDPLALVRLTDADNPVEGS